MSYTYPTWGTTSHSHTITNTASNIYQPFINSGSMFSGTTGRSIDQYLIDMMKYPQKYQAKEKELTTLEKVKAERQEARERQRIERLYEAWDAVELGIVTDGAVMRFTWNPERAEHPYTYAALVVDHKWYVTGHTSPNGLASEDFIAWLIGKNVEPDDVTWLT